MLWYETEMMNAGMLMPATSALVPMPSPPPTAMKKPIFSLSAWDVMLP
jgi:hypothetical protein